MRTGYKVRTYPTQEQAAVLNRTFGRVRQVSNKVLAWRCARHRTERVTTLGFLLEVSQPVTSTRYPGSTT
ncbi:MAG: helix-turn-helix domain-containing protein [Actinoallomurus sp.]